MPVERKPLFRPDVLREHAVAGQVSERVQSFRSKLDHWSDLIATGRADKLNEKELLPDFLTDFFVTLLGYTGPAGSSERYTLRREKLVEVDGNWAEEKPATCQAYALDQLGNRYLSVAIEAKLADWASMIPNEERGRLLASPVSELR